MAKAKLTNKKKGRFKIEALATLILTLSIFIYLGAIFGLKSYNVTLVSKSTSIQKELDAKKETVAQLKNEVTVLENRDRILGLAEKDGIKTNQDNVTVMSGDEKNK